MSLQVRMNARLRMKLVSMNRSDHITSMSYPVKISSKSVYIYTSYKLHKLTFPKTSFTVCYLCFRILSHLGSGQFGSVSEAEWRNGRRQTTVAVKTLTDSANTVKFLQEAAIMAQFKHPNILTLHGVVSAGHPVSKKLYILGSG